MQIKYIRRIGLVWMLTICMMGCTNQDKNDTTQVQKEARAEIYAMDTIMNLTVYASDSEELLQEARELVYRYENLFSVNVEDSDVSRLNRANGKPVQVSEETRELIQKSLDISEWTDGLFDISIYPLVQAWGFTTEQYRVPGAKERNKLLKQVDYKKIRIQDDTVTIPDGMQIDLGGIAKGYLSQKLVDKFRAAQAFGAVISLGGNVQTYGKKPDGTPFRVGITEPSDANSVRAKLEVGERAVITSGSYQRYFEQDGTVYHHIMDKRTGMPADSDLKSVTVIMEDGVSADSLATALFVMGKEGAITFEKENPEVDLILIDAKDELWASEGIQISE